MNLQQPSPFTSIDKQTVIGALKATRSTDADVLHAQKATLMQSARFPKLAGTYVIVMGILCTVTILLAIIGIPLLFLGGWMRRRGSRNLTAVEDGFKEYLSTVPA
jgi:hypothetical protein